MIGEIIFAVMQETLAFMQANNQNTGTVGTVILKTDYQPNNQQTYGTPFVLVDLLDAEESGQMIGGITRMDWQFALNSYNLFPDNYMDDQSGTTAQLLNFIDSVRQHFSLGIWLTQWMPNVFNAYGFKFTLSGVQQADALDQDGTIMGYRIVFDSTAFDSSTSLMQQSTQPLTTVTQVDNPPFN